MDQLLAALDGAWRVLVTCLILGSGLPALYTVGLRQLAIASGASDAATPGRLHVARRVLAYAIFALVIGAILLGIGYIVAHGFGWKITFDGVLPVFIKK